MKNNTTPLETNLTMETEFSNKIQKLNSKLKDFPDHWATSIVDSIWTQYQKYNKISDKQIELIEKIDREFADDVIFRQEWDDQKASDWKNCVDYYSRGPYYSNITRKARSNIIYIPTRSEFDKLVNNKYAQRYLKNLHVPAKFEIGDLVQIRKNRSWYADEFAMIIEDKGVQSHVEGGRVYTIQFLGKTDTAQLEERDLKIMRKSAVDKKAKEKDNNV